MSQEAARKAAFGVVLGIGVTAARVVLDHEIEVRVLDPEQSAVLQSAGTQDRLRLSSRP